MMRNVLGEINWTAGLKAYLTARQFDGANADHLYVGLQSAIQGKNVLPEGVTVKAIMDTWANEKGYPVLSVRRTYETGDIIISQERFISDRKVPNTNVWMIPYNYVHQSKADFDDLSTFSWLSTKAARINTEVPANEWIIFNKQQVGYYRVNYDANNWELITNALINNLSSIDRLNRAQLIDDAYWLARSGRLDIEVLMKLLTYLKDETEYAPWTAANNVLSYFNGKLRGTPAYKDFTVSANQRHIHVQSFISRIILDHGGSSHQEGIQNSGCHCSFRYRTIAAQIPETDHFDLGLSDWKRRLPETYQGSTAKRSNRRHPGASGRGYCCVLQRSTHGRCC